MRNRNKIRSFWKQNIKENSRFQLRSIDRDVFNFLKSISFFPTEFDYFDSVQTIDRSNERRTTAVRRLAQHCFCALGNCIYFISLSERDRKIVLSYLRLRTVSRLTFLLFRYTFVTTHVFSGVLNSKAGE